MTKLSTACLGFPNKTMSNLSKLPMSSDSLDVREQNRCMRVILMNALFAAQSSLCHKTFACVCSLIELKCQNYHQPCGIIAVLNTSRRLLISDNGRKREVVCCSSLLISSETMLYITVLSLSINLQIFEGRWPYRCSFALSSLLRVQL